MLLLIIFFLIPTINAKRDCTFFLVGCTDKEDYFKPELVEFTKDVDKLTVTQVRDLAQVTFNIQPERLIVYQEFIDSNGNILHYMLTDEMIRKFVPRARIVVITNYNIRLVIKSPKDHKFLDGFINLQNADVAWIRNQIWQWWGVHPVNQTLFFGGNVLTDEMLKEIRTAKDPKDENRHEMTVTFSKSFPKSINVEDIAGGKYVIPNVFPYSNVAYLKQQYCNYSNNKPENINRINSLTHAQPLEKYELQPDQVSFTWAGEDLKDIKGVLPLKLSTCNGCTVKVTLNSKAGVWWASEFKGKATNKQS